jgi:hypothetical protein
MCIDGVELRSTATALPPATPAATVADQLDPNCTAWTECADGLQVAFAGTTSRDQLCGLKLVASTFVPLAVSDMDAFKTQLATASGAAGAIVEITSFEQKVTSVATVPGVASDYEGSGSEDARTQFRTGVSSALGVDLPAVSDVMVTSVAGRRLQDVDNSDARRLQTSSVSISYEVTVTDTALAAHVATIAQETDAFAQTLVTAVNAERPASDQIDASLVTVDPPSIDTNIQYEVIVETSDTSVIMSVQSELGEPSVLAQALDDIGVTVAASALIVIATVACSRPAAVQGYTFVETSVLPGSFDVVVSCAAGYY